MDIVYEIIQATIFVTAGITVFFVICMSIATMILFGADD